MKQWTAFLRAAQWIGGHIKTHVVQEGKVWTVVKVNEQWLILEVKGSQVEVKSVINYDVMVTESAPFHLADARALNISFENAYFNQNK